jgi:hypothetical protein
MQKTLEQLMHERHEAYFRAKATGFSKRGGRMESRESRLRRCEGWGTLWGVDPASCDAAGTVGANSQSASVEGCNGMRRRNRKVRPEGCA